MKERIIDLLNKKNIVEILIFSLTCLFFLIISFVIEPRIKGDGGEYFLMLESFSNHLSSNLTEEDINSFQSLIERDQDKHKIVWNKDTSYTGYFQGKDKKYYSYHFWAYSLITFPVKKLLSFIHSDLYSYQAINTLLLLYTTFVILLRSNIQRFYKFTFLALFIFNPIIWFIFWPHPEVFSTCFVVLSLISFRKKNYKAALFCSAIASTQNQPILVLFTFYLLFYLIHKIKRIKTKQIILVLLSLSIAILPSLFYFLKFGNPNLIYTIGAADIKNFSLLRLEELFFDLNIGIFPYLPLLILATIFLSLLLIYKLFTHKTKVDKRHLVIILGLYISIVLEAGLSTFTSNWNHGTNGPSRYVLWMIPIITYLFTEICRLLKIKFIKIISATVCVLTIVVTGYYCYLIYTNNNSMKPIYHSPFATFILNSFPHLYNPSPEIFVIRTGNINENIDMSQFNGIMIYRNSSGICKKVYLPKNRNQEFTQNAFCTGEYKVDVDRGNYVYISY